MTSGMKKTAALMLSVSALLIVILFCKVDIISAGAQGQPADGPPVVKITAPANNSVASWNSLVNYSIVATYHGKSTQYQELPSNEVLLKTTYVPDVSTMAGKPVLEATPTPAGLLDITNSTCLGCHEFKAKAMGPSFAAIGKRYPQSEATIDTLCQHVRQGSTGVWGQGRMPAQSQLTEDQLHAIVRWIIKDAADPDVNYYVGTKGALRMEAAGTPDLKGRLVLSASYTSPSSGSNTEQSPHGEDVVILSGK